MGKINNTLPPFKRFCITIGNLPSSYVESMSYYECIMWLCKYLKDTVIPAVNENAEAVNDLIHWFENLDVQEEINNKLDEMAESGVLAEVINETLFNNINEDIEALDVKVNKNKDDISGINSDIENINSNLDDLSSVITQQTEIIGHISSSDPIIVSSTSEMTNQSKIYALLSNLHIYVYSVASTAFVDTGIVYGSSANAMQNYDTLITSSNYETLLPDANAATVNTIYKLNFAGGSTSIPANLPFTTYTGGVAILKTYNVQGLNGSGSTGTFQIFMNKNFIAMRTKTNYTTYTNWDKLYQTTDKITVYSDLITSSNYETLLADANSANTNTIYRLNFAGGSTSIPANLPFTTYRGGVAYLQTINKTTSLSTGDIQIFENREESFYRIYGSGSWGIWFNKGSRIVEVGASDNLVSIIDQLRSIPNITYLISGEHDLYTEFLECYGNDYFTSFSSSNNIKGLPLYNNMTLIGSSNSKLVFNYTGTNSAVKELFSPITASIGSYTLDNITIECSNCRYAIHDELGGQTVLYYHKYKNCNIYIDNTNNDSWNSRACIGGGLGKNGEIIIENCIFESEAISGEDERNKGVVSYHNNAASGSKSNLVFTGNVIKNSDTFRLGYYGTSTAKSNVLITNNSIGSVIQVSAETQESEINNFNVIEFNNIVRQ